MAVMRHLQAVRRGMWGGLLAGAVWAGGPARAQEEGVDCPMLDVPPATFVEFTAGYTLPATVTDPGSDDTAVAEAGFGGELHHWENDLGADVTFSAHWLSQVLTGYGESSYALNRGYLRVQYQQRFLGGVGLILEAEPGIYSALDGLDGGDFGSPCGATLVKAFNPRFALLAGARIYPTFDRQIDPRFGFRWRPNRFFTLDLAYPETRLTAGFPNGVRWVMGAWLRRWPEFGMGEDPRERLRFEEGRAYGGLEISLAQRVQLQFLGGYAFGRKIEFEREGAPIEFDDAPSFQVGIAGLF